MITSRGSDHLGKDDALAVNAPSETPSLDSANRSARIGIDRAEVSRIVREHGDFVWRTLRRLGIRDADVDDVCQEVFLVVLRRREDYEPRSSLKSWLYGIVVRTAAAHRRKAPVRREVPTEQTEQTEQTSTSRAPDGAYEDRQELLLLDRALATLEADKREVFVLYEVEELPMTEVSRILECPLQTAYSRHRAARDHVVTFFKRAALTAGPQGAGE